MLPMIEQKVQQNARIDLIRGYQAEYIPPMNRTKQQVAAPLIKECVLRKNEDHISLNRKILNQRSANLPPKKNKTTSAFHLRTPPRHSD